MHAIINSLPDPNYATLRALTLVSRMFLGGAKDADRKAFESSTGALCRK